MSAGGISFLHGGFVYDRTRVRAQLISTYGTWQNVSGTVVGCRLVRAPIHEVRVKFDQPIAVTPVCVLLLDALTPVAVGSPEPTSPREQTDLMKLYEYDCVRPEKPKFIDVGEATYLAFDGKGAPSGPEFVKSVGVVYGWHSG